MEKAADVQSIKDQVDDIFRVEMEAPPGPPGFSKEERELGISEIDPRGAVGRQPHTGALCKDRLEDAVASVRYTLRNDVFIEGTTLSDERRGKWLHTFGATPNDINAILVGANVTLDESSVGGFSLML